MDELMKDLIKLLTMEVKSWSDDERSRIAGAEFLAARLTELGYVKVVRCGECKNWGKHFSVDDDGVERGLCKKLEDEYWCDSPFTLATHYCSEGEAKEDK